MSICFIFSQHIRGRHNLSSSLYRLKVYLLESIATECVLTLAVNTDPYTHLVVEGTNTVSP